MKTPVSCRASSLTGFLCVLLMLAHVASGCGATQATTASTAGVSGSRLAVSDDAVVDERCVIPGEPTELVREGDAVLLVWELEALPEVWFEPVLPNNPALLEYRYGIIEAGAALRVPVADPPDTSTDRLKEVWRREFHNQDVAYAETAGLIRPASCFESLFLGYQANRFSQLTKPTEFIVAVLWTPTDDGPRYRVYFAGADTMFPPKSVYPFQAVEADMTADSRFLVVLHNHTVQSLDGAYALGVTAPSTHDVVLSRSLAEGLRLEAIQVTNGFFTVEIPTAMLDAYLGPAAEDGAGSSESLWHRLVIEHAVPL